MCLTPVEDMAPEKILGGDERLEERDQARNIVPGSLPYPVGIGAGVVVDETVAHADDGAPRNLGVGRRE